MSEGIGNTCIPEACWDSGLPPAADAATDASSNVDATPDATTTIDATTTPDADTRTWQPLVLLANVNTSATESFPSISTNGLDLYFTRPGELTDIYVASRASTTNDFGSPVPISTINTSGQEWAPHISSDNLELYFFRLGTGIMVSKRSAPGAAWGTPVSIGIGGSWADSPTTTGDGLTIYFIDQNTAGYPLFRSTRPTKTSAWGTPAMVSYPGVARYRHVSISRDGLGLLLSSAGLVQNTDVIVSWKQSVDDQWTSLEVIPSLLDETLSPHRAVFNATADEIYLVQNKSAANAMDTELWVTRKQ